jgi:hypothetical protein
MRVTVVDIQQQSSSSRINAEKIRGYPRKIRAD